MAKRKPRRGRYLCRKVEDGEIIKEELLEAQAKYTLLTQAPAIVSDAVAKGWISYPINVVALPEEDPSHWIHTYDCERAYQMREDGATYRSIAKFLCCAIGKVHAILNRGRELAIHRKRIALNQKAPSLPSKETISKHITTIKGKR